jgi:hypothetical protein
MQRGSTEEFAAFVGLDWADAKHDVCVQAAGTERREFVVLEHRPEAIDAWVCALRTRFNGQPVAVCLELNKGPIVSALRKYDILVLFPVNPLTLAKYREAFTPSRAKDDWYGKEGDRIHRQLFQERENNPCAHPVSLKGGEDGHIIDRGVICAIGQGAAHPDERIIVIRKHYDCTPGTRLLKCLWVSPPAWSEAEHLVDGMPVYIVHIIADPKRHRPSLPYEPLYC